MRGIAGEKHAAVHEAIGYGSLSYPETLVLDRVRYLAPHATPEKSGHIGVL